VPFYGVMKGGIFLREMPLGSVLSGYSNSGTAVASTRLPTVETETRCLIAES